MGSDFRGFACPVATGSFNPRSRMGSDPYSSTFRRFRSPFQSTLPHGERRRPTSRRASAFRFNPRSRMGSDPCSSSDRPTSRRFNPRSRMGSDLRVSISARSGLGFNPRSRMGSDQYGAAGKYKDALFQSTLPHGERHRTRGRRERDARFNPRSRMGSDRRLCRRDRPNRVSIHAPAWGATSTRSTARTGA